MARAASSIRARVRDQRQQNKVGQSKRGKAVRRGRTHLMRGTIHLVGRVAPGASPTPGPGEQRQHSKAPGLNGPVFCKGFKAAGRARQS